MPVFASLKRSLTLPLNRKQTDSDDLSPPITPDPRPSPRRYNSGGIFNSRSTTPKTPESTFVVPAYVAPDNAVPNGVVFGKPLKESLRYANVQISTADANGDLYVWGYIPVVVAKCGLYLKENGASVLSIEALNVLLMLAFSHRSAWNLQGKWLNKAHATSPRGFRNAATGA
jgi:GTPase-activating protein SAC7